MGRKRVSLLAKDVATKQRWDIAEQLILKNCHIMEEERNSGRKRPSRTFWTKKKRHDVLEEKNKASPS